MDLPASPTDTHKQERIDELVLKLYWGFMPANQLQSLDALKMSEQSSKLPTPMTTLETENRVKTDRNHRESAQVLLRLSLYFCMKSNG